MSYTYLCENFICSPGQAAESLAECCSDTPQFALWKLSLTADASCSKDSATESYRDSRFGTTSPHSTASLGADGLTSCAEVSPAKTFPPPEKAQESMEHGADCGGAWPAWFAKFDRVSSSWKTRQCSLLAGLDAFSGTWPRWGMMRGGVCWELTTSGHRTGESESGFWPTPRSCSAMAATITPESAHAENRFPNLETVVGRRMWATPKCQDSRHASWDRNKSNLGEQVAGIHGGQLNPNWVEWLMGWPIGWTDLKPLETDRCHSAPPSHGAHSQDTNP
jgi:hypothetical protein